MDTDTCLRSLVFGNSDRALDAVCEDLEEGALSFRASILVATFSVIAARRFSGDDYVFQIGQFVKDVRGECAEFERPDFVRVGQALIRCFAGEEVFESPLAARLSVVEATRMVARLLILIVRELEMNEADFAAAVAEASEYVRRYGSTNFGVI